MIFFLLDQLPNEFAALQLLEMFDRLLKKYARMLGTEDAYEELRLFFLELLYKLKEKEICTDSNGAIVNYISKSVRNQYIALSKARNNRMECSFADVSEEQMLALESISYSDKGDDISFYFPAGNTLTEREHTILRMFYADQYTIEEIAKQLTISRQAVNQAKNRALERIRKAHAGE